MVDKLAIHEVAKNHISNYLNELQLTSEKDMLSALQLLAQMAQSCVPKVIDEKDMH